jgi:hypothetical protein
MQKVLAYVLDQDCDLVRSQHQPTPMRPDGLLEPRRRAEPGDRLVTPTVFLGRSRDGRLGFLCELVDSVRL